jgi:hypothetical protein
VSLVNSKIGDNSMPAADMTTRAKLIIHVFLIRFLMAWRDLSMPQKEVRSIVALQESGWVCGDGLALQSSWVRILLEIEDPARLPLKPGQQ